MINQLEDFDLIAKALYIQPKPKRIVQTRSFYQALQSEVLVRKIGCDYHNQTLLIQFSTKSNPTLLKTKRIHIKKFIYKDTKQILESLRRKFPEYLGSQQTNRDQIIEAALQRLLFSESQTSRDNRATRSHDKPPLKPTQIPQSVTGIDENALLKEVDLNKVSDELNKKAKELMDKDFEVKRLKPGDVGYVWDKQIDFGPAEEDNDWDEEDDD